MIVLENIRHTYQKKEILKGLNLSVAQGEIFGLLGPNGSGKTTLFRILSTAMKPSSGVYRMGPWVFPGDETKIREKTGVVFQSPSLDGKLTVSENLKFQGKFYGISGKVFQERARELMQRLGILERAPERVDRLSGGLKRRVELAKALLHRPELLVLDEPSTGLDPGSRKDLWHYLKMLCRESGITILVTTHWMEEAESCGRVAIMHEGRILRLGKPEELKQSIHGKMIAIRAADAELLKAAIQERFGWPVLVSEGTLLLEHENPADCISKLTSAFENQIQSLTLRKPTLEDVFLHETGHRFWQAEEAAHV